MKCKTCGMERGDHDRACVREQLHAQKLGILKKLVEHKKKYRGDDFAMRIAKSVIEEAMTIVRES